VARARWAPCLLTANVPDPLVIMADPGQWSAAASVLVRAVVFDRLRVDHPAVSRLLNVLAPIAEAELAHEAVPPRDILRVGLKILSVVAGLCRSDSVSILDRAA
jgi:hypothetical protein